MVRVEAGVVNEHWSMDFVSDALFDGRRFWVFAVVDNFSRECLGVCLGQSLRGEQAVTLLKRIQMKRRAPKSIRLDNRPEFISKSLELWAPIEKGISLDFSRPGKPTDSAFIESFYGRLRGEYLSVNWFLSLEDARDKIISWRRDCNEFRPHSSLGDKTPSKFARSGLARQAQWNAGMLTGCPEQFWRIPNDSKALTGSSTNIGGKSGGALKNRGPTESGRAPDEE
jgi:putative transposase